jgi:glycosyltransferase involved in cell wall biosynthesis
MKAVFCVTNDLNTDQRMIRICSTLQAAGWQVELIGRKKKDSSELRERPFQQTRLNCFFQRGKLFYLEYNLRLLCYLLFLKMDVLCVIDLDTALPGIFVKNTRNIYLVYDAHELFPMVPEVQNRKLVQRVWFWVERRIFKKADLIYTVGTALADYFEQKYHRKVEVIRNMPNSLIVEPDMGTTELNSDLGESNAVAAESNFRITELNSVDAESETPNALVSKTANLNSGIPPIPFKDGTFILYQGALNQGRGLERLLRILTQEKFPLLLVGSGDVEAKLKQFVLDNQLQDRVHFMGFVRPELLPQITRKARIGYNVSENEGLSYYLSLNNKFFDYAEAGLPSIINDFPEYVALTQEFKVGLVAELNDAVIAEKLRILMENDEIYQECVENCLKAREIWSWKYESQRLIELYKS